MASQDCPFGGYVEVEILTGPDAGSIEVVTCSSHGEAHSGRIWWSAEDVPATDDGTGEVTP